MNVSGNTAMNPKLFADSGELTSSPTSDDDLDWLAVRILMLGVEVDVHEPPELVQRMGELAARMGRAVRR
ncbi:MAG: WCX domain-containing protein [Solirubrobacteraceae bacterium]